MSHAQCRAAFADWLTKLKYADWERPDDIKSTFRSADLLGNSTSRVVFDIAGNSYRMICKYVFGSSQIHLFVCWIGTHAAYTTLCKAQKQYIVNAY
ncbi:type II toxin-antitoxin system HigB family toxin [Dyadobacter sp. CY347]|uniref:type II toxin-antitoxin system HigB family toxin n=1 Tax=Dyadobacter sp. CY347 TaxID=2909336 RepID=UPI001F1ED97C|nr:type II toxin-antitoxin system HigB family toxin [Dyadobacter sp. CY347]MCF2489828.1 type II toxin-antitoxin system HigB family toxin [Dyadobacter sp. CY347]